MATCQNCGKTLSCGCQKKQLSDGKMGCTYCAPKQSLPKQTTPSNPTPRRSR